MHLSSLYHQLDCLYENLNDDNETTDCDSKCELLVALLANLNDYIRRKLMTIFRCKTKFDEVEMGFA